MNLNQNHYNYLKNSYEDVGSKISNKQDFNLTDLQASISLFETNSSDKNSFTPIFVDVYAILSGISFDKAFTVYIEAIQQRIKSIIEGSSYYLVEPSNLGVEYAVLKWPNDSLSPNIIDEAKKLLNNISVNSFHLNVFGIQIHQDGCIILKCYDENRSIFKLRDQILSNIKNIPVKQSNWAHIPLGRILSPVGKDKMVKIKHLINEIDKELNYNLLIESVHLVHEKQWYMKQKEYLLTKILDKK